MGPLLGFARRWGAALALMAAIFYLSSQPGVDLPKFGSLDYFVKKSGHVVGYGILALTCWRGFEFAPRRIRHAWWIAVLYAVTDEIHQAFVPGRHPSVVDLAFFDGIGAAAGLFIARLVRSRWSDGTVHSNSKSISSSSRQS